MDRSIVLLLLISVTGLVLIYFYPGSQYESGTLEEVKKDCDGKVKIQGRIIKTFYSEKGNYIGIIASEEDQLLVLLPEEEHHPGDEVEIKGIASKYRGQCFIFPDEIRLT